MAAKLSMAIDEDFLLLPQPKWVCEVTERLEKVLAQVTAIAVVSSSGLRGDISNLQ